ncbi:MAG TPA: penicillin-binding protein 2 [Flavisolibacter sp.]|nr:penicillin-binding protein 2 [Flavisolibacter sp.]
MPAFTQSRSYIIRFLFIVAFLIMFVRLFTLQVFTDKYQQLAQENAVFKKIVFPPRGIVYDRKGKAIVNNVLMYDLMVVPSEARNVDTAYVCQLLEIDTTDFKERMITAIIKNGRYRPSVFESLLSPEKHARLEENMWRFGNGFFLQDRPVRTYPYNAGGHFMGYIGEVDSAMIARSENFYQSGDYAGRSGLEATYERILMGQRGVQYWIKDNRNKLVGRFENGELDVPAIAGRGLQSYIDIEVQQLAERLLTNKVGAVVAIDPKTGGIIAMASGPFYNPNDLSGSGKQKNYSKLVLDVAGPLLNRAIKGQYPPGSTFKPIGALVALDEKVITASFGLGCGGAYYGCNRPVRCTHKNPGHAANLRLSIANSCNSYYSHIYRLTVDNPRIGNVKDGYAKWREYMLAFGLGARLGIDLPSEDKGNIPDTSVYNKVYRNSWNSCTNITLGIGQDMMLATPLQLANAMCLIANKGFYYTPHFIKSIQGETKEDTALNRYRIKHEVLTGIPDTAYQSVILGMNDVVTRGTARSAAIPGIDLCAKTGTAENFRIIDGKRVQLKDNSVFVAFAPMQNPKIAIAVVVENAGFGSTWAAPIASLMIEKYLTDSLRTERKAEVERITSANLMPSWLAREQYKTDSVRAYHWFKITKDSNYIKKYLPRYRVREKVDPKLDSLKKRNEKRIAPPLPRQPVANETPQLRIGYNRIDIIDRKNFIAFKKKRNLS